MSSIRILLADDYEDWRREIHLLIQARPEWQVISEVSDGLEAVQKAEELKPELLLLDVGLPNLNGIEAARRIRRLSPNTKIVFVSLDNRSDVVEVAMSTGARGYVYKSRVRSDLLPALDAALQGKQFVSRMLKGFEFSDAPRAKASHRREDDHSHFEELAALEAGGFLSDEEHIELRIHTEVCFECRNAQQEFERLVRSELPLTVSPIREFVDKVKSRPDNGIRQRFLQRARSEGIVFSSGVGGSSRHYGRRAGFFAAAATALAAIVMLAFYGTHWRPGSRESMQAEQQVDRLRRENSALSASLSQSNESVATGQREIQNLRAQLGNVAATAENLRRSGEQAQGEAERSTSQNAQLLDESRNQEKLLADARDEAALINQLRVNDEASLGEQQARITELSNRLRIASATLDQERQLAAAGKDVRELMLARQLHVIDVRDTDPSGTPSKAFGRVFLTEGKSLTFYAFDLNEDSAVNAKRSFQVWAVPEEKKNSARSLGFLQADAKAQGRWVLRVENPELVKDITSVFVSVEPQAAGSQPSGQKMLYAYLGEANHP